MELDIFEAELHIELVRHHLYVYTRAQAEEEYTWIKLAWYSSNGVESAAAAAWMTKPRGVIFSCLDRGSWYEYWHS